MERIVESLTTGVSEKTATVVIDNDKLDIAEDPHGFYKDFIRSEIKQAASDQRDYIKSKAKLLGTIKSMTSKELEDKIATRFIQLQSELDDKLAIMAADTEEARTIKAVYTLSNVIDHKCPLQTWQAFVTLITTRQSGNKRLDLNAAMNASASLRQRNNETLFDYLQRFEGTLEYFNLVDPTYTPKEPIQAIKFLTSLDPTTYSTLLVDLQNELNWGRDLYPNDLAGAMSLVTKFMVVTAKGPKEAALHAIFGAVSKPTGKGKAKDSQKKPQEIPEKKTGDPPYMRLLHKNGP